MATSEPDDPDFTGGTSGARGATVIRFDDAAGLYAATRFTYSDLERAEIVRCLEAALGTSLPPHGANFFFFHLGSIGIWGLNTILQVPELEDERAGAAAQIDKLRSAIGLCAEMHDDPNVAVALSLLTTSLDGLTESFVSLSQRIEHIKSRYPGAGNNRWFAQVLQFHLAEAFEGQGGEVSGAKAFLAYHDAIVRPVLENAAVRAITGCMWTEGMGRTFADKYRKGEGRRR